MATADSPKPSVAEVEAERDEWLGRLSALVDSVRDWARELGWSTRRIEKAMKEAPFGSYRAPALLLQEEFTRILLEPLGWSAPGAEGVVDLYLMPAYDDVARLIFTNGRWELHHMFPGRPDHSPPHEPRYTTLSKETLQGVLEEMRKHGESL